MLMGHRNAPHVAGAHQRIGIRCPVSRKDSLVGDDQRSFRSHARGNIPRRIFGIRCHARKRRAIGNRPRIPRTLADPCMCGIAELADFGIWPEIAELCGHGLRRRVLQRCAGARARPEPHVEIEPRHKFTTARGLAKADIGCERHPVGQFMTRRRAQNGCFLRRNQLRRIEWPRQASYRELKSCRIGKVKIQRPYELSGDRAVAGLGRNVAISFGRQHCLYTAGDTPPDRFGTELQQSSHFTRSAAVPRLAVKHGHRANCALRLSAHIPQSDARFAGHADGE